MRHLREPFQIIRVHPRAYLTMNAITYGLFLAGVAVALAFPDLNAKWVAGQREDGTAALVALLLDNVWLFSLTIFGVNVLTVAVATILLPSMIVPFAGIVVFMYRVFVAGVTLAPVDETTSRLLIPHSLAILIELQAYVLVLLAAYLLGKAWLWPNMVAASTRRQGYLRGLRQVGWLSVPALALFLIGAIYEAFELVYLVPALVAD